MNKPNPDTLQPVLDAIDELASIGREIANPDPERPTFNAEIRAAILRTAARDLLDAIDGMPREQK